MARKPATPPTPTAPAVTIPAVTTPAIAAKQTASAPASVPQRVPPMLPHAATPAPVEPTTLIVPPQAPAPQAVQAPSPAPALALATPDTTTPGPNAQAMADLKQAVAGVVAGQAHPHTQPNHQNKVPHTMDNAMKSAEEFVSFSQGNMEAMMKAGQIWAAGFQDLQKAAAATAQAQVEATLGTLRAMSSVKSVKEAMDLQATLARSSLETAMNETGKMTDASIKLAEQTMAPITARVTLAVEKFGRVA
jgi:hypothetical protein